MLDTDFLAIDIVWKFSITDIHYTPNNNTTSVSTASRTGQHLKVISNSDDKTIMPFEALEEKTQICHIAAAFLI